MRVILNPAASNGAGARLRPLIERELTSRGIAFDLVHTAAAGDGARLARAAAADGVRHVVAAGGDGTIHEVVNGLMTAGTRSPALGVLPIGTGNDFVKILAGITTIQTGCDALAAGTATPVDVGVAEWDGHTEYFINAMGTGIDVEVVRRMRRIRFVPGGVLYATALAHALVVYRPLAITVRTDAGVVRQRIMNLAVCNGPSIGGSFRICPDARVDDGLLDTCLIAEMTMIRNARMVPRVLTGTHPGRPGVTMLRGRAVHLSIAEGGALPFQLDGELREAADGAAGIAVGIAPIRLNVIRGNDIAA